MRRFILMLINLTWITAGSLYAGTFDPASIAPESGIDVLNRGVARQAVGRSLFADPYATVTIGHVDVYDVVRVEIVIYSFKQNQLVWAGETESVDPGDVDEFVQDLAEGTAAELQRLWLVPS